MLLIALAFAAVDSEIKKICIYGPRLVFALRLWRIATN